MAKANIPYFDATAGIYVPNEELWHVGEQEQPNQPNWFKDSAIGDAVGSVYTGLLNTLGGGISGVGFHDTGAAIEKYSQDWAQENLAPELTISENGTDYFTNPGGMSRDFGNLIGSGIPMEAATAAILMAIPEPITTAGGAAMMAHALSNAPKAVNAIKTAGKAAEKTGLLGKLAGRLTNPKAQAIAGALSAPVEATVERGAAINSAMDKGYTEDEAVSMADQVWLNNNLGLMISNAAEGYFFGNALKRIGAGSKEAGKALLSKMPRNVAKKEFAKAIAETAVNHAINTYEEGMQQGFQRVAEANIKRNRDDVDAEDIDLGAAYAPWEWNDEQLAEARAAFGGMLPLSLLGIGSGAIGARSRAANMRNQWEAQQIAEDTSRREAEAKQQLAQEAAGQALLENLAEQEAAAQMGEMPVLPDVTAANMTGQRYVDMQTGLLPNLASDSELEAKQLWDANQAAYYSPKTQQQQQDEALQQLQNAWQRNQQQSQGQPYQQAVNEIFNPKPNSAPKPTQSNILNSARNLTPDERRNAIEALGNGNISEGIRKFNSMPVVDQESYLSSYQAWQNEQTERIADNSNASVAAPQVQPIQPKTEIQQPAKPTAVKQTQAQNNNALELSETDDGHYTASLDGQKTDLDVDTLDALDGWNERKGTMSVEGYADGSRNYVFNYKEDRDNFAKFFNELTQQSQQITNSSKEITNNNQQPKGEIRNESTEASQTESEYPAEKAGENQNRKNADAGQGKGSVKPSLPQAKVADKKLKDLGNETDVTTDDGKTLKARYKLIEGDKLIMSHDPNSLQQNSAYPKALQPRDRQRAAMGTQVDEMAAGLNPDWVADSRNLNQGAPVIFNNRVVANGNGRAMAIYRSLSGKKGAEYRQYLKDNAEKFGIDSAAIDKMKKPVLVRVLKGDVKNLPVSSIINSTTGGEMMSAGEQAKADAAKITDAKLFDYYVANENGDLTTAANREFVGKLLNLIGNKNERNKFYDDNGGYSKDAIQRCERALFAKAYGVDSVNSDEFNNALITKLTDNLNDPTLNITKALLRVAPKVAAFNTKYQDERLNPAKWISEAAKLYQTIKNTDEWHKSVDEFLNSTQLDLGDEYKYDENGKALLKFFDDNKRKINNITKCLNDIVAECEAQFDNTPTFEGMEREERDGIDIIKDAIEKNTPQKEENLFEQKDEVPPKEQSAAVSAPEKAVVKEKPQGKKQKSEAVKAENKKAEPQKKLQRGEKVEAGKVNRLDVTKVAAKLQAEGETPTKGIIKTRKQAEDRIKQVLEGSNNEAVRKSAEATAKIFGRLLEQYVKLAQSLGKKDVTINSVMKKIGLAVDSESVDNLSQGQTQYGQDGGLRGLLKTTNEVVRTFNQFVGEKGAANLDAAQEATTRLDNLAVARKMEKAGKNAKTIKQATGWERGADKLWRYETDDTKTQFDYKKLGKATDENPVYLGEIIINDELLAAYPELKNITVSRSAALNGTGEFDGSNNSIKINKNRTTEKDVRSTLFHEIQHAIQVIEGMAKGGGGEYAVWSGKTRPYAVKEYNRIINEIKTKLPFAEYINRYWDGENSAESRKDYVEYDKSFKKRIKEFLTPKQLTDIQRTAGETVYEKLAGEVEARNVSTRMNMSLAERLDSLAEETEDVSRKDQIVIRNSLEDALPTSNRKFEQRAWHGSPHVFDRFDLGAIGTGEGAQAHGYGLYFAKDRNISENYQDILSNETIIVDGEKLSDETDIEAAMFLLDESGDAEKAIKSAKAVYESVDDADYVNKELAPRIRDFAKKGVQTPKGSLFEVEVPDNDVLLDEQERIGEQTDLVKNAVKKAAAMMDEETKKGYTYYFGDNISDEQLADIWYKSVENQTGKQFYRVLSRMLGSDRAASEWLNEQGVEGITYDGAVDGRCYVVFDDKAVEVINRFNQQAYQNDKVVAKGAITFGKDGRTVIETLRNADQSTVVHELAHLFLEEYKTLAAEFTNSDIAKDIARIEAWAAWNPSQVNEYKGTKTEAEFTARDKKIKQTFDEIKRLETGLKNASAFNFKEFAAQKKKDSGLTKERFVAEKRAAAEKALQTAKDKLAQLKEEWMHERFARGFEEYLRTGEAQQTWLKRVFEQFKEWLNEIYQNVIIGGGFSPEVETAVKNMLGDSKVEGSENQKSDTVREAKRIAESAKAYFGNKPIWEQDKAKIKDIRIRLSKYDEALIDLWGKTDPKDAKALKEISNCFDVVENMLEDCDAQITGESFKDSVKLNISERYTQREVAEHWSKAKQIDNANLTAQEKKWQEFGKALGLDVKFFDGVDKFLNGRVNVRTGEMYLNRNAAANIGKTFWHETFHPLVANNPQLMRELKAALQVSDDVINQYRNGREDLKTASDDAVLEEILADNMADAAKRLQLFKDVAKKDRGLIERFIGWIKDALDKFVSVFNNPTGKLTNAQRDNMSRVLAKMAGELKDGNGNKIFKVDGRGNISLADGRQLNSAESIVRSAESSKTDGDGEYKNSVKIAEKWYTWPLRALAKKLGIAYNVDKRIGEMEQMTEAKYLDGLKPNIRQAVQALLKEHSDNGKEYLPNQLKNRYSNEAIDAYRQALRLRKEEGKYINPFASFLMSPSRIAEKYPVFRPLFNFAQNAMDLLVSKRNEYFNNYKKALELCGGEDGINELFEILAAGDEQGKNFTEADLKGNGVSDGVIQGYLKMRELMKQVHDELDAARRKANPNAKPLADKAGYIPHFFHQFMVKIGDENGETVGSARNLNDAYNLAETALAKLPQGTNLVICPKTFDFAGKLGMNTAEASVVMGDNDYYRMTNSIHKNGKITLREAREIMQKSARKTGRHRFNGSFLHRTGAKGYSKEMKWVLEHHLTMASRYIAMETEFKPQAITYFEKTFGAKDKNHSGMAKYASEYIDDVNGTPSAFERTINDWLNRQGWWKNYAGALWGDRAAVVAANKIAGLTTVAKLGCFNISSGLVNLTQSMNVAGYLGDPSALWRVWKMGAKRNYTAAEQALLDKSHVADDVDMTTVSGYDQGRYEGLGAKTMFFFSGAEKILRRGTILVAYEHAKNKLKLSDKEALDYAVDINNKSNFDMSVADAPNIFRRGSILSTLFLQFKKYPIKELEVMRDMLAAHTSTAQKATFWGTYFLFGGIFQLPFSEWLDENILETWFGRSYKREIKKYMMQAAGNSPMGKELAKVAMYGLPSIFGVDTSARTGIADVMPSKTSDFVGPTFSTIHQFGKALGEGNSLGMLKAISPGAGNIMTAIVGERKGKRDRVAYSYSNTERLAKAAGFRTIDETMDYDINDIIRDEKKRATEEKQRAVDAYLDAESRKDRKGILEASKELKRLGIKPKTVNDERKRKRMTNSQRIVSGTKKPTQLQKNLAAFTAA